MSDSDSRAETILVVEDAEAIRKMVCAMLSSAGYRCLEASNGHEALEIAQDWNHSFELVLTDMVMPRMGGVEFVRHLSTTRPEVRVVFMSGYSEDPLESHVERRAAFLSKPFTASDLLETVRESLDRP